MPQDDRLLAMSTGSRVAGYVRRLIWTGALRAGDRVRQSEIADALGVSRIPVREGLVALEGEGLVRHEPQRGVFVLGLDRAFITDHYALLGLVLGYVIEQAVLRGDEGFQKELEELSARVVRADSAEELFPLAVRFKELVCSAGSSTRTRSAIASMERLVPGNLHIEVPGSMEITRTGIPAIVECITLGDGSRAFAATRAMTREVGIAVFEELQSRGVLDAPRDSHA